MAQEAPPSIVRAISGRQRSSGSCAGHPNAVVRIQNGLRKRGRPQTHKEQNALVCEGAHSRLPIGEEPLHKKLEKSKKACTIVFSRRQSTSMRPMWYPRAMSFGTVAYEPSRRGISTATRPTVMKISRNTRGADSDVINEERYSIIFPIGFVRNNRKDGPNNRGRERDRTHDFRGISKSRRKSLHNVTES